MDETYSERDNQELHDLADDLKHQDDETEEDTVGAFLGTLVPHNIGSMFGSCTPESEIDARPLTKEDMEGYHPWEI